MTIFLPAAFIYNNDNDNKTTLLRRRNMAKFTTMAPHREKNSKTARVKVKVSLSARLVQIGPITSSPLLFCYDFIN